MYVYIGRLICKIWLSINKSLVNKNLNLLKPTIVVRSFSGYMNKLQVIPVRAPVKDKRNRYPQVLLADPVRLTRVTHRFVDEELAAGT